MSLYNKGCQPLITGNDLRKIRILASETTYNMAEYAVVKTRKTYENWEANKSAPDMNQFAAMMLKIGFDPALLLAQFIQRNNQELSTVDLETVDWESCRIKPD